MKAKKQYDDDDGRTVADMSGVSKASLIIPKPFGSSSEPVQRDKKEEQETVQPDTQLQLSKSERRSFIMGTLSASILIGLVFAAVFAALILLIIIFGK